MFCCFSQNDPKCTLLKTQSSKWTKLFNSLQLWHSFVWTWNTETNKKGLNIPDRLLPAPGDLFPHAPRWHNDTLQEIPGNIAHLITECKSEPPKIWSALPLKPQPHIRPHCPSSDGRDSGCENQSCPHATLQGLVTAVSKTCAFSSTHTASIGYTKQRFTSSHNSIWIPHSTHVQWTKAEDKSLYSQLSGLLTAPPQRTRELVRHQVHKQNVSGTALTVNMNTCSQGVLLEFFFLCPSSL